MVVVVVVAVGARVAMIEDAHNIQDNILDSVEFLQTGLEGMMILQSISQDLWRKMNLSSITTNPKNVNVAESHGTIQALVGNRIGHPVGPWMMQRCFSRYIPGHLYKEHGEPHKLGCQ